ncbi:unnamed protein product [Mortierella alpina]
MSQEAHGCQHPSPTSEDSSELDAFNVHRIGFSIIKDGTQKTVELFDMAQELVGIATTKLAHGKRKLEESTTSGSSDDNGTVRTTKRRKNLFVDGDALSVSWSVIKEARRLTEARNEQLRLMVLSQIVERQMTACSPTTPTIPTLPAVRLAAATSESATPTASASTKHTTSTNTTSANTSTTAPYSASQNRPRRSRRIALLHQRRIKTN